MMHKITNTRLRKIDRKTEPLCQLDLFCDKEDVARGALKQLREADRLVQEAGLKLRPLVKKRK